MPRKSPDVPLPTCVFTELESFTVELKTITPMFGGSATNREVNEKYPVRAASVRGHLRFWWRATAGAGYENAEKLFEAESAIWGRMPQPLIDPHAHGKVRIEVLKQQASLAAIPQLGKDLDYAIFPFKEQQGKNGKPPISAAKSLAQVEFTLRITCPTHFFAEVQTALHAWVLFGGIGSRTRRGCGSLAFAKDTPVFPSAPMTSPDLLTTLPNEIFVGQPQKDAQRAWAKAVAIYKNFRQQRNPGSGNRPGRSHWPESDSIRRFTPTRNFQHAPVHPVISGFPRADLGLPIIFHFQKQREYIRPEPEDHTLQGAKEKHERFASPVITKAMVTPDGFVPVIMILNAPHVWEGHGVKFRDGTELTRLQLELTQKERFSVSPLNGQPIREALKTFITEQDITEQGFKRKPL